MKSNRPDIMGRLIFNHTSYFERKETDMMKMTRKKMMMTASAFALGALLFAGGVALAAPSGNYIGSEKAQQIALENAGLSADSVTFIRTHLDYDDGRAEYEVEFYQRNMEYDYDIDAVSGTILSYDHDAEYYDVEQHASGTGNGSGSTVGSVSSNTGTASAAGTEYITAEAAKQAALQHAGVSESDTCRMETGFDYEHGMAVYEIEWKVDWTEYSYEINASTGEVVSYEMDYDD